MWIRVVGVLAAVLLTAAGAYAVFTAPTDIEQAAPPGDTTATPPPAQRPRDKATRTPAPTPSPAASATPTPAPSPTGPPPTPLDEAERRTATRLTRLVGKIHVPGLVGMSVLDADGQMVFEHQATTTMLPASTQKMAVAAAALVRLGPDHRFTTTVNATVAPNAGGVIHGDLVMVGGGDPTLATPEFASVEPDRPRTPLATLASRIKLAGVRRVTGRVLADPTFLSPEPIAAGWPPRYFDQLDATRISGLTVDAGRRLFTRNGYLQATAASDPARTSAVALRRLLRERGVRFGGGVRVLASPKPGGVQVASIASPPLGSLLQYMVQHSDNHLADTVFRTIGAAAGESTWVGAAAATADALAPLQLDWSNTVLADGSGLSRADRVTPRFLAQLQSRLWRSNLQPHWVKLLAVAGVSGTLKSRLTGTVAQRRVYGKTGSLRDVTALVGTVIGTRDRTMHFAILGNRLSTTAEMRTLTDKAVLAMAEELQDCRRVRPPPRKGDRKRKDPRPLQLVCG
jgi:D-alanyl-D-alanine carboxypeptidase/D-alanyl-D-alanine-endopeptidase (penicillin-binding protein 4)